MAFLTIGMPTYDDFSGVFFTVQALRLYHAEVMDDVEILVVDNHPSGPAQPALQELANAGPNIRYVPYADIVGSAPVKDHVIASSHTPYTMCVDCHVLLFPGAVQRLIQYCKTHPSDDLFQGPYVHEALSNIVSTGFELDLETLELSPWISDPRGQNVDGPPFEIRSQSLAVFITKTDAWLGYNPHFRGFLGEEFYLHEKYRQAGRKTLCLPFLRWMHPPSYSPRPYPARVKDYVINTLIGWRELGWDTQPVITKFQPGMTASEWAAILQKVEGAF